jgi:hypothetical protein
MARHYHVDIAVVAANADRKWVDNLLSHFDVPGVEVARQGVARRISTHGIYHVALTRLLSRDGGMSVESALGFALHLLTTDASRADIGEAVELRIDRPQFQSAVDRRVADAVEAIVPKRRGRPPSKLTR